MHRNPLILLLLLVTLSCGGDRPTLSTNEGGRISGTIFKGRVSGATVRAYRLNGLDRGALVGNTTSADDGTYVLEVGASEGPLLVSASGGSFVDEATGATIQLNADELTTILPRFSPGTQEAGVLLSPVSHLATALTLYLVRTERSEILAASDEAWRHLNGHFGNLDWRHSAPTDVTLSTSSQLDASAKAGLLLAALSQEALIAAQASGRTPGGPINPMALTTALYNDLVTDGLFNGVGAQGQLSIPATGADAWRLTGQTLRFDLATALAKWLQSERNTYRVSFKDLEPLIRDLSNNSNSRLFAEAGGEYDNTPPVVTASFRFKSTTGATVTAPSAPPRYVRGVLELEVDLLDASQVRSFTVTQEGRALTPATQGNTSTHYVGTWDAAATQDGELVFVVTAEDGVGNRGETRLAVVVDNTAPSINFTAPLPAYYSQTVRVEATAADSTSGLQAFTAQGLAGFVDDDSQAVSSIRGTWTIPADQVDGKAVLALTACDVATNCRTQEVSIEVDRTPPALTLIQAPPRYTADVKTAFAIDVTDAAAGVKRVIARTLAGTELPSTVADVPGGKRFTFSNVDLGLGLNTFTVTAEDLATPPNLTAAPLVIKVGRDNVVPTLSIEAVPSYFDERTMTYGVSSSGVPLVPAVYKWPGGTQRSAVLAGVSDVWKRVNRLSGGPSPTADELENDNAYNVPFVTIGVPRTEEESPITGLSFSADITCTGCSFPAATGQLLPSTRTSTSSTYYVLPLTAETIPALRNLPATAATVHLTFTATDSVGNTGTISRDVTVHLLGGLLQYVPVTTYAAEQDPASIYTYGGSRYGSLFTSSGSLRVAKYLIRNPAPYPVPLRVFFTGSWRLSETWPTAITKLPAGSSYMLDGFTFNPVEYWTSSNATSSYPCGGLAGAATAQFPYHTAGSSTRYLCGSLPTPTPETLSAVPSFGKLLAGSPGASTWGSGYWVPAASATSPGELVLYVQQIGKPTSPFTYNWNGSTYVRWIQDFWKWTNGTVPNTNNLCGTPNAGPAPSFCAVYEAHRVNASLSVARHVAQIDLRLEALGSFDPGSITGEAVPVGTDQVSNLEHVF
ncbi:hypothetical protein [Corallococcus sp. AB038B]|uniref:hypothetical protein n=1 Tax=Corallococcus sp. AB038B TaxID=2316718 RepID=UPI000ED6FE46|nr:hypothetical protein [Corallococcus sp. AB038B]RKH92982.1 hypothetical protein D7Y04_41915 [Corallococcus sp. AB038B]